MVWTGILAFFIYVCVQVVPVFINGYQFEDAMKTTARFASVNRQSADDIRQAVFREAQKGSIPIRPEDIKVTTSGGNVQISTQYTVTVDLKVYQWKLNFRPTATNSAL